MITAGLCLAITLLIFWYVATAETSYAASSDYVAASNDADHKQEQQSRITLDEALQEISEDEASAQRKLL